MSETMSEATAATSPGDMELGDAQTTAQGPLWFDDLVPRDLRLWALTGAFVVALHVGAIAAALYVRQPDQIGDDTAPIAVDFSPGQDTADQAALEPIPVPPPPQAEQPPPPPPPPQAVAILEPPPPPPKVEEQPEQQAQPARVKGGSPQVKETYRSTVAKHLAQHMIAYPRSAVAREQHGRVEVAFSVDHEGRVHDLQLIHSSGHSELDSAALAMVEKAQPFPALPQNLAQQDNVFDFPLKFDLQ
jgi:TonB family protein